MTESISHLVKLELENNTLVGPVPSELGLLSHLKVLKLYNNRLSGSVPAALCNNDNNDIDASSGDNRTRALRPVGNINDVLKFYGTQTMAPTKAPVLKLMIAVDCQNQTNNNPFQSFGQLWLPEG